jgi:hypothetical protein
MIALRKHGLVALAAAFLWACSPNTPVNPAPRLPPLTPAPTTPAPPVPALPAASPAALLPSDVPSVSNITTQPTISPSTQLPPGTPSPTDSDPRDTLPFLASPELQGRGVGTPGLDRAADFIGAEFAVDGLQPVGNLPGFFQQFDYVTKRSAGSQTILTIGSHEYHVGADFNPIAISAKGEFSGSVVFVGYGITAPESNYDDYAGLDVKGKIVLAMRFEPMDGHGRSKLLKSPDPSGWSQHATFLAKAQLAAQHGAVALLVVSPPGTGNGSDALMPMNLLQGDSSAPIPVLHIKQAVAEQVLVDARIDPLSNLAQVINTKLQPDSQTLPDVSGSGKVQIEVQSANLRNVVGEIPGQGPHADELVIVGAHYDHVGTGALGHQLGPAGVIYPGADDNASGTATILALAARMAHQPPPQRTIVFVCFTAEEIGLVGSNYFVAHSPIQLDRAVAMYNMDMVGRMSDQTLFIGGQGTAADFDQFVTEAANQTGLKIRGIGRGGMGPSDHMTFALKRIPVLFAFSGMTADYHRPTDTADKINFDGIGKVVDFSADVITDLANMPREPYLVASDEDSMSVMFTPAGITVSPHNVVLGIVPDVSAENSHVGVLINGTTPDGPAFKAGLLAGDLIVRLGNAAIANLNDLGDALTRDHPGDVTKITVMRDKQEINLPITLAERPQ